MEPPLADRALVERANRAALETLYRRHRDWVLRVAYRFTGDRQEALDVLQDAFAYLFAKLPALELTGSLRSLLYPTVKHLSLDRRRRARPTADVSELADVLPAPPADPERGLVARELLRGLEALPAAQREVVLMRFADDLTLQDIADALAIPLGTVKSRLHHALETLRARHRAR